MTTTRRALLLLFTLLLLPVQVLAVPINEIRFEGNRVTQESVLRQELLVHEGDEVNIEQVEASRQAIMNLGLFKSVTSRLEEDGLGRRLVFTMDERYFLLPIPLINGDLNEDNYSYGMELRHDNMLGLNQRLKVSYETEESIEGTTPSKRRFSFNYAIPHLVATPYALSLNAKRNSEKVIELDASNSITTGSYHQEVNSGSFFLSRWVEPNWISQGWTVGAGMGVMEKHYDEQVGSGLIYEDSQLLTLNTGISYNHVSEHIYHRSGTNYGYTLSVAEQGLGSDYGVTRHWLYYRLYQPLKAVDANINCQLRLGLANGRAFGVPTYSIGNSSLLRGYESDYAEGDAMLLLNLEYHHRMSGYRQLRGVLFTDVGNAWERPDEMHLDAMPVGVGVGLRWRVQSFVDLTLRMDYARALQYDNSILTLTTSSSF